MQILVKVETGFNCNWRNIEPLQPEGFKGQTANEKETLKNSIVKNGFHDAFDVWQHDNKLLSIDGVHRKIALLELAAEGYEIPEQLPCNHIEAKDETEAATIILSRNSQHSHIIRAAVLMEACAIPAKMIEAVVPQKNLEAWSESDNSITEQLTAEEDDFEFEDGGIETDIVIGDLFEIGEHRLLCGDSTDSDSVAKLMNGEKADMVTDPPYGIDINMNMGRKKGQPNKFEKKEWDKSIPDFFYLLPMFDKIILWGGNYFADKLPVSKNWLCWYKKTNGLDFGEFELAWTNCDINTRLISHHWSGETKLHPTMKPVTVMAWCLEYATNKIIFDPFIGSGSTMVAAHQLKRKCYGMELDPKYCQVIIDRMRKLDPTLIIKRNGVIYE